MKKPTTASNRTSEPYSLLAAEWDAVSRQQARWFSASRRIILGDILESTGSACDLACGTGRAAVALARRGVTTYAVDASDAMCRRAKAKARRLGIPLTVIRADMRRFRLPESVDLILCEYDSLNHLRSKGDLALVLRSVARALNPAGYFYFDVNNARAFRANWSDKRLRTGRNRVVFVRFSYDPVRETASAVADWFVKRGRLWERTRTRLREIAWTPGEIRSALRSAGFDRVSAFDAAPFFHGATRIRPGWRTFYLARKAPRPPRGAT